MDITDLKSGPPSSTYEVSAEQMLVVLEALSEMSVFLDGEHAVAAGNELIAKQPSNHVAFFGYLSDWLAKTNDPGRFSGALTIVREYAGQVAAQGFYGVLPQKGGAVVQSADRVPIIRQVNLDRIRECLGDPTQFAFPPARVLNVMGALLAAYLQATRRAGLQIDMARLGPLYSLIRQYEARLAYVDLFLREQPPEFLVASARIGAKLAETDAIIADRQRQLDEASERIAALHVQNEHNARYGDTFVNTLKGVESDIVAWKASIEEKLNLGSARALWGKRGSQAAYAFYVSAGVLVLVLAAIPSVAFHYRLDILEFLKNMETTLANTTVANNSVASTISAVGKLALISAPLAFVVWLIKLLVRFNMRSMLLMDDALQRVTMLDTYLFMVEKDAAAKQDRGAVLEALFRRAPGHGPDTVEPPHFTDLLKFGQDSSGQRPT